MIRTLVVTIMLSALAGLALPLKAQTLAEAAAEAARRRAIAKSNEISKSPGPTTGAETDEAERPTFPSGVTDARRLDGATVEPERLTTGPKQGDKVLTTSEIAATVGSSVVTITTLDSTGREIGQGSGFLVRGDGVIVTNWHVLAGAAAASIMLKSGASFNRVMFLGGDQAIDVALIRVQGADMPTVQMTPSLPDVGAKIVTLGSPLGFTNTVSEGIVSAIRDLDGQQLVQVTAPISPGSSGGAILDQLGRVFAISTGSVKAGQQINFGIPVKSVLTLLESSLTERPLGAVFASDSTATVGSSGPMALMRQRADQGDADAQHSLAKAYYGGSGVPQDYTQAAAWFRKAADQGHIDAAMSLATMYALGQGVPKDETQAGRWDLQAANQGRAAAQFLVGVRYGQGRGMPQDQRQAVAWVRKAADQGLAEAESRLGLHYELGRGVLQDDQQAFAWYRKAAEQGFAEAQLALGLQYMEGRGIRRDYTEAHKWVSLAVSTATGDTLKTSLKAQNLVASWMTKSQLAEARKRVQAWQAAFEERQLGISSAPLP